MDWCNGMQNTIVEVNAIRLSALQSYFQLSDNYELETIQLEITFRPYPLYLPLNVKNLPVDDDVYDLVDCSGGEGVVVAELLPAVVGDDPEAEVRPGLEAVPDSVTGRRGNVEHHHPAQTGHL